MQHSLIEIVEGQEYAITLLEYDNCSDDESWTSFIVSPALDADVDGEQCGEILLLHGAHSPDRRGIIIVRWMGRKKEGSWRIWEEVKDE